MQDKKLERATRFLEVANEDYATHQEVADLVKTLVDTMKGLKTSIEKDLSSESKDAMAMCKRMEKDLNKCEKDLKTLVDKSVSSASKDLLNRFSGELDSLKRMITESSKPFDSTDLQNQINVLMEYETPELEAVTVRDLLETLTEEERLDASAIKNLPEATKSIVSGMNKVMPLYNLLDVDIAGITAGQTIQWDGNKWIAYTPAGSGGTPVWGEDLTSQGPGTSYTLANTPVSGTVRVFKGGAYQQAGAGGDYTISGAVITFNVSTQEGEIILCDYSY